MFMGMSWMCQGRTNKWYDWENSCLDMKCKGIDWIFQEYHINTMIRRMCVWTWNVKIA